MQAVIYVGEGVDIPLMKQIISQMATKPKKVGRHFFLSPNWEANTDLVIIPGGRDIPYDRHLRGEANDRIRRFVENGGSYLGICAGGYYGSAMVIFEEGGELEVLEKRELAFFPGRAIGPVFGKGVFAYNSKKGACEALLNWKGGKCSAFFNGGCYFEDAHKYAEVIATYADLDLPAIISCKVGKGRAILSGVHPECPVRDDHERSLLWKDLLNFFKY